MSAIFEPNSTSSLSGDSLSQDLPTPSNHRATFLAFLLGLVLAGATSFFAWQGDVFTTQAALQRQTDPRLERLLSLTESQRDCDTACLGELRMRSDKVDALEQALGNLQAAVSEAGQKMSTLESEKTGFVDLSERHKQQIQALEKENADLVTQLERQKVDLEAGYKQTIATLEAEKNALAEQASKEKTKLTENHKLQIEALEKEKAALAAQMERQKTELETNHQKQVTVLEKRIADSADSQLQAGIQAQERPTPERLARQIPMKPIQSEKPGQRQVAVRPPVQTAAKAPTEGGQKWTVLGMTASTVVVSTPDHRVVALAAGESMDGMTVHRIDLDKGVAQTNLGDLQYAKK